MMYRKNGAKLNIEKIIICKWIEPASLHFP